MGLSTEQVSLAQTSWAKCVPIAGVAADLFYGKLSELDPTLRPIFPADLTGQKKKLMDMITIAVEGLTNLSELVPAVQDLGRLQHPCLTLLVHGLLFMEFFPRQ